jgi:hypothetical protein
MMSARSIWLLSECSTGKTEFNNLLAILIQQLLDLLVGEVLDEI